MSEQKAFVVSNKRKNPSAASRKAAQRELVTSCIVMKWKTLCKNEFLREGIHDVVSLWTRLAFDAYQFLNFHFLRCIAMEVDLPEVNQTLMYRCCCAVSLKYKTSPLTDFEMQISKQQWVVERNLRQVQPIDTSQLSSLFTHLPVEMLTACKNHIILNFTGRLFRWMKIRFHLKSKQCSKVITAVFDRADNLLPLSPDQQMLFDMLLYRPVEWQIKKHLNHFIRLSYFLARDMEERLKKAEKNTEKKGIRTFTLFPLKHSLIPSHIPINTTTLPVIINYILKKKGDVKIGVFEERQVSDAEQRQISDSQIASGIDPLWNKLFCIQSHTTSNRHFAKCITTNGYSASLHLQRLKPIEIPEEDEGPPTTKLRLSTDQSTHQYSRKVACDPGHTNLFYGVDQNGKHVKASTKEYRFLSKMNGQRKWNENLKCRFAKYKSVIESIPSLALTNHVEFLTTACSIAVHRDFLYDFCAGHGFLKWKFKTRIFSAKTLVKLCKRICRGVAKDKVVVGIGDWSRKDGLLKGHPSGPVKKWKKCMQDFATVLSIDEYGTSVNCSKCKKGRCRGEPNHYVNKEGVHIQHKSHKILRCSNNECRIFWHRDMNSANNHYQILDSILNNQERPTHLERRRLGSN